MEPEDLSCLRRVVMESKEDDWVSWRRISLGGSGWCAVEEGVVQRVGNLKVELEEKDKGGVGVEWRCGFKVRGKG